MSDEHAAARRIVRDIEEGNAQAPILGGTGPIQLSRAEWRAAYGPTINESPLHLDHTQRAAISEGFLWTQVEDGEGIDWLVCGEIVGNTQEAAQGYGRLGYNVLAYWLSARPWDTEKNDSGDIHARLSDLKPDNDEGDEGDEDEGAP